MCTFLLSLIHVIRCLCFNYWTGILNDLIQIFWLLSLYLINVIIGFDHGQIIVWKILNFNCLTFHKMFWNLLSLYLIIHLNNLILIIFLFNTFLRRLIYIHVVVIFIWFQVLFGWAIHIFNSIKNNNKNNNKFYKYNFFKFIFKIESN